MCAHAHPCVCVHKRTRTHPPRSCVCVHKRFPGAATPRLDKQLTQVLRAAHPPDPTPDGRGDNPESRGGNSRGKHQVCLPELWKLRQGCLINCRFALVRNESKTLHAGWSRGPEVASRGRLRRASPVTCCARCVFHWTAGTCDVTSLPYGRGGGGGGGGGGYVISGTEHD